MLVRSAGFDCPVPYEVLVDNLVALDVEFTSMDVHRANRAGGCRHDWIRRGNRAPRPFPIAAANPTLPSHHSPAMCFGRTHGRARDMGAHHPP